MMNGGIDLDVFLTQHKKKQQNRVDEIDNRQYITVQQYAERTNRSPVTVRQMCNSGRIEGAKKNGKSWLIPVNEPSDIAALREENIRLRRDNARLEDIITSIMAIASTKNVAL